MNAQNDQDSPTTRGPRPLEIPDFAAKLDLLLASEGKNQEWLRHTLSVAAPNISRWKRKNRMPRRHALVLCRLLDIELNVLLNADLTAFKRNIEGRLQLGSGKRWQTFAATAAIASKALRLYIEEPEAPSAQQRLRSLDFRRSSVTRSASRKLPSFKIDERLRIVLDPQAIPAVSRSLVAEQSVILIEDPEKLSCLCPSAYASQMTLAKGLFWLPGPEQPPLHVNGPGGRHSVYALLISQPLPADFTAAFETGRVVWASDALVAWLTDQAIEHCLLRHDFYVIH